MRVLRNILVAASLAACGGGDAPIALTIDSAGIEIVTSEPPIRLDTIRGEPIWSVAGSADGESAPFLDVTDLAVTSSGIVVVASNGSRSLVAFGPDGSERWRFGREGEGPGEFRGELSLAAVGDTVVVWDFITRRMTVVAPEGKLARVIPVETSDPNLELAGSFADGTLFITSRRLGSPTEGINRDSVVHLRFGLDGSRLGEVGWSRLRNVDFVMGEFGPNLHDQAFGPTGAAVALGDGVAGTDGGTPQVAVYGIDGHLARLLRWQVEPIPVGAADREAFGRERRAIVRDEFEKRQVDEWLERATWSTVMPVSGVIVAMPNGGVLVADYCAMGSELCAWREFDTEGRWGRTVAVPVHAEDAVMVGSLLVTLTRDELGLERLDAWEIGG